MFCSILVFHVRDMLSSHLISDIYNLVLDGFRLFASGCRDVFEGVVDGFRWF